MMKLFLRMGGAFAAGRPLPERWHAFRAEHARARRLEALREKRSRLLALEVVTRVLADVAIVNACYAAALLLRLLFEPDLLSRPQLHLNEAVAIYLSHFALLTLLAVSSSTVHGIYGRGRLYRGRFKAVVIVQAVSITYLTFGFIQYVGLATGFLLATPRIAMLLGWGLTLAGTLGARVAASVWEVVVNREKPVRPESNRKGPIRRVLVIGGAGYIGSILCRDLLARGYSVRVLDALLYGKDAIELLEDHSRFELIHGDSRDIGDVVAAMLDVDAVVHLGELVGDPACALNERLTLEINLAATRMLAEVAWGYGIKRFIYASSCSVYGASDGDQIVDEDSALKPVSLYARAKVGCEQALAELGDELNPVILRLSTVFGLSHRPRFDLVVNLLTAQAASGSDITVFGGTQYRPFVHVTDVARAILRCLEAPLSVVKGQTFNVGNDAHNHSLREVGEMIHRLVPEAAGVRYEAGEDRRNYRVAFGKIEKELGFTCKVGLEEGIRELAEALRSNAIGDYRSTRYSNHKTLSDPTGQPRLRSRDDGEWALQLREAAGA